MALNGDIDTLETKEWLDSLAAYCGHTGRTEPGF